MLGQENNKVSVQRELERLRAENAALREQVRQLDALTMVSADLSFKMNADWNHVQELKVPAFQDLADQSGQSWLQRYISPENQAQVSAAIAEAIKEKKMFEIEHPVLRADGEEGWTLSRAIPMLDDKGNIKEWLGVAIDITARKKAELDLLNLIEEAGHQKRLYETIIGSTPDLVYVFDLDARFTYANEALLTMWGRTKENSFGKSLLEIGYEPWHAAMHEREIEHIKQSKESVRGEVAFPHATLGKRIYDYILVPVLDAMGQVTAIAGTTRDITEIRKLSEQKDEFLAIASHELKTPLTSVKGYAQILQSIFKGRNDAEALLMLSRMDKQINKLTGFITDLLDVTRIQSGKLQFNQELFDLAELTVSILDELQLTTTKHVIKRDITGPLHLYADMDRIGQVVTNLVTNAIKYSPAGGDVLVRIRDEEGYLLLSVKDVGIGIPADRQSKVFEQFYRANNYRPAISGMGIGLYISAEIVQRSGGKIWVDSMEGVGSTFFVTLPKYRPEKEG